MSQRSGAPRRMLNPEAVKDDRTGFLARMQMAMSRMWTATSRPDLGRQTVYEGTADAAKVARRRARNKVAARSRRVNRLRAKH